MNKNNILAILIIVWAVLFFNGPFKNMGLYEKMGGTPPSKSVEPTTDSATVSDALDTTISVQPIEGDSSASTTTPSIVLEEDVVINDTLVLENSVLRITFSEKGAEIIKAELKEYKYGKEHPRAGELVSLLSTATEGIAGTAINGKDLRSTHFDIDSFATTSSRVRFITMIDDAPVAKTFTLADSSYYVDLRVTSPLLDRDEKSTATLFYDAGIDETESKDGLSSRYSQRTVKLNNSKKTSKFTPKTGDDRIETDFYNWATLSSKYFSLATIFHTTTQTSVTMENWVINEEKKKNANNLNFSVALEHETKEAMAKYTLFIGPNESSALAQADVGLEKTLFRGYAWFFLANLWFPKICEFVLWLMNIFFILFKDYGIAIILITFILKAVTYPLSQSSMKSMSAMQELKPKLDKLQAKYKNNQQLYQQKMMELYKEEGINPLASLGGCLPMLLQFPIMISLFLVLRTAIQLRGETTFLVPWLTDLSQAEAMFQLPFVIPIINTSNFAILPLMSAVLMYFQNKTTMKDPAQRQMLILMPFMMGFMFYTMPSGLNLYFVVSSLLQILQHWFMEKQKAKKAALPKVMSADGKAI